LNARPESGENFFFEEISFSRNDAGRMSTG
jgi:hypothetical protein